PPPRPSPARGKGERQQITSTWYHLPGFMLMLHLDLSLSFTSLPSSADNSHGCEACAGRVDGARISAWCKRREDTGLCILPGCESMEAAMFAWSWNQTRIVLLAVSAGMALVTAASAQTPAPASLPAPIEAPTPRDGTPEPVPPPRPEGKDAATP